MRKIHSRHTLMDKAYEVIKKSICSNQVRPGELLSEVQLAKELQMSRTPVREALKVLETEDLVEIHNGIGAFVKKLSFQDVKDIYELRIQLETLAIRTAVFNMEPAVIDRLRKKFRNLQEKKERGGHITTREFTEMDWELHETIVKYCDNRYVKHIMISIHSHIKRFQLMSVQALNNFEEGTRQHLDILDLLARKDVQQLEKAIARHINWSMECFVSKIN